MIGFAPYRFPSSSTGAVIYLGLFILAIRWAVAFGGVLKGIPIEYSTA
jgi:hypothetical protein